MSHKQAKRIVKQSILIYNNERPHLSLGYQTPQAVYPKCRQKRPHY